MAVSSFKKDSKFKIQKDSRFSNGEKGQEKAKFSKKIYQNVSKFFWNIIKYCMFCWNLAKIDLKRYYFLQDWKKAKWPNHFTSRKLFQKRPNKADLAFIKAKWQPCLSVSLASTTCREVVLFYLSGSAFELSTFFHRIIKSTLLLTNLSILGQFHQPNVKKRKWTGRHSLVPLSFNNKITFNFTTHNQKINSICMLFDLRCAPVRLA